MKKKSINDQAPEYMNEAIPSELANEASPGKVQVEESPYFTKGKWGGMEQWNCRFCPWDTLEGEQTALEHYLERHAKQAAPVIDQRSAGNILVADRYGNPIE